MGIVVFIDAFPKRKRKNIKKAEVSANKTDGGGGDLNCAKKYNIINQAKTHKNDTKGFPSFFSSSIQKVT